MKNMCLIFVSLFALAACAPGGPEAQKISAHPSISTTRSVELLIESHHPYGNNHDNAWEINAPEGATSIIIPFERLETERNYDFVEIYDADGTMVHNISGNHTGESFTVEGDYARIRLVSDYSIDAYGILITRYQYTVDESHVRDHRPYCGAIGSRSEGWYWGDTDELIKYEPCAAASAPTCEAMGTRSEGWYSDSGIITWDFCHRTVRVALEGETCGPSIGFSCHDNLFCAGLPLDTIGGTGTCIVAGSCTNDLDCFQQHGNPDCAGSFSCQENACVANCVTDPEPEGIWSWSTFLAQGVESTHPYANNFSDTWDVTWPGAAKIKVHFAQYDVETNYDYLTLSGNVEEISHRLTGADEDVWSNEYNGDTVHINMATDYSVTRYGFRVDMISIYHQLPVGACNVDSECGAGEFCHPNRCFSPYTPCHGTCQPTQAGNEGDPCDASTPCAEDLICKHLDDAGSGTCQEEQWCDAATVAQDCANLPHIMVPGNWTCEESVCRWQIAQFGGTFENTQKVDIPDNDAAGITSTISVSNVVSCTDQQVSLTLDIGHTYIGDLLVTVTDPQGVSHVVHNRTGGSAQDLNLDEVTLPLGVDGVNGTWTLFVSDNAGYDVGTLEYWSLTLGCSSPQPY